MNDQKRKRLALGLSLVLVCLLGALGYELYQNNIVEPQNQVITFIPTLEPQAGEEMSIPLPEGERMEFVWIPPGTFQMGSPPIESDRDKDETQHRVTISQGYWMGKYEVTQEQWEAVMGNNPSRFKGAKRPVERVSWNDCQEFIAKLNQMGHGEFRLPTEAEWEYACRAGTQTTYYWGDDLNNNQIDEYAWYGHSSGSRTHEVGQKRANAWGLYDMSGNVWEWCNDRHGGYPNGYQVDPLGKDSGTRRVRRGGSWNNGAWDCRSANRSWGDPDDTYCSGFRVSRTR